MNTTNYIVKKLEEELTPSEVVKVLSKFNKYDLENYAVQSNICPICFSALLVYTWKESRGEYFGIPCNEEMSEYRCEGCGSVY